MLSGSLSETGMEILDKSLPMFFRKMLNSDMLLSFGFGAGSLQRLPVIERFSDVIS